MNTLIILGVISALVIWVIHANRDRWKPPDDKS